MSTDRQTLNISIIIPTLNEGGAIATLLAKIQGLNGAEIIVVDGGSHDNTAEIAASHGVKLIKTSPGRALQMNKGAEAAQGDILLFLHCDTWPEVGFAGAIRSAVSQPGVVAGAFRLAIRGKGLGLRMIEWLVNFRSIALRMPYGDQGIFLLSQVFKEVGGYPLLPIMEDFELIRRLRRRGKIRILPLKTFTSDRHWNRLGILRTTLLNQAMIIAYLFGVTTEKLADWYRKKKA
jgi:rSAM/selenodomain-associated transferase 2